MRRLVLSYVLICIVNLFGDATVRASSNGNYRLITDFPYVAQLTSGCGAAIISADWVISAAHCVGKAVNGQVHVVTGSSTTLTGGKLWNVSKIFVHGGWVDTGDDICLLKLETPIKFDEYEQPIRIAKNFTAKAGDNVTFAGYGLHHHEVYGIALRSAQVPIVEQEHCSDVYHSMYPNSNVKINDKLFCTSTEEVELCPGDSGSPTVFNNQLIGVLSYGCEDYRPNSLPSGFTKLASYYDWIMQITGIEYDN